MDMRVPADPEPGGSQGPMADLLASEFTCHCCYEVLVDPTTLTCGHSFCRHCLATWWASAHQNDCPECRAKWQGFPKVNILLRDAVEKRFPADVDRRKQAVLSDTRLRRVLQAFQQHGERRERRVATPVNVINIHFAGFRYAVLIVLSCMAMVVLAYRAFSADSSHETLLSKPLRRWSCDDVTMWVEHLGVWTNHYKETFHREQINGRLLSALSDDDLSAAPFMIENQSHRRIILEELHKLKELRVSLNLWKYKELNLGKSLFLLISLRNIPRLTLLYLYLFDYDNTFLPFILTACPSSTPLQDWPGWWQWAEFVLMYFLLPHQLLAAFAWPWLSLHSWTAGVVIAHAALLSLLDVCFHWTLWTRGQIRTLPRLLCVHVFSLMINSSLFVLLWPLLPLFFIDFEFYLQLYFVPFKTALLVKKTLQRRRAQRRP